MTTTQALDKATEIYDTRPKDAFMILLQVVAAQDYALRCSIGWSVTQHGTHGVAQLLDMLQIPDQP